MKGTWIWFQLQIYFPRAFYCSEFSARKKISRHFKATDWVTTMRTILPSVNKGRVLFLFTYRKVNELSLIGNIKKWNVTNTRIRCMIRTGHVQKCPWSVCEIYMFGTTYFNFYMHYSWINQAVIFILMPVGT